jgi:tRNA-splicing ligase RtcB
MKGDEVIKLGYKPGKEIGLALHAANQALANGATLEAIEGMLNSILATPSDFLFDPVFGTLAAEVVDQRAPRVTAIEAVAPRPYQVWGQDQIDPNAIEQMDRAVRLPIAVRGALMPDAHVGYGLPIGGVLATKNAVIPYAVGVDIACRMRMTIYACSSHHFDQKRERFRTALEAGTLFGAGKRWEQNRDHAVMEDPLWREHPIARRFRDIAWNQLGSSGSGNHFAEFGMLTLEQPLVTPDFTVDTGRYIALLTHSGSRRLGQEIANYYTDIAMEKRSGLPKEYLHLAWLDMEEEAGAAYWAAMNLAGRYASANHAVIHEHISAALRLPVVGTIENHHNFAWREQVDGQELIVHRKGATPAGRGVLGVIPGSMSDPGYVVRGRGDAASLNSAAHGAGRRMSRNQAQQKLDWETVHARLKTNQVELLSAGLDEAPMAYKNIHDVMAAQSGLIEIVASFQPRLVKMDGSKGKDYRPED